MKLIVPASTQEEIDKSIAIRKKVFVEEQGVSADIEVDERDVAGSGTVHFIIYEDADPVGTFRITINDHQVARLQRYCVLSEYRGRGYGSYGMEFVEGFCQGNRVKKIVFDAQCTAIPFYEKLGYKCFSEEFEEAGMLHRKMSKRLTEEQ